MHANLQIQNLAEVYLGPFPFAAFRKIGDLPVSFLLLGPSNCFKAQTARLRHLLD